MFRRLFLDHPQSVGESYAEHFRVATGFGATMILGGIGACIHGLLPFVFTTTGSDTIEGLHTRLVAKRTAKRAATAQMKTVDYII